MDLLTAISLYSFYEAIAVRRYLLVYSLLRKKLRQFFGLFLAEKIAQAVLLHAFIIQSAKLHHPFPYPATNKCGLLTAMASYDRNEAMTVSRNRLVYSWLRK